MPKMKTKKAVASRIKVTGRGKLRKHRPLTSHLASRKSPKRLRKLRGERELTGGFAKQARKLLGL
ncbi:MAG TPA: 50S ribosomal protein L35 [Phycisphaerae bacterium]|nr:50S ribosomal protein L35 [Phycisphaerae bacterium]